MNKHKPVVMHLGSIKMKLGNYYFAQISRDAEKSIMDHDRAELIHALELDIMGSLCLEIRRNFSLDND